MKKLFVLLLTAITLNAQEKIEVFGTAETHRLEALLSPYEVSVEKGVWETYAVPFKKDKSWVGKLRKKLNLRESPLVVDPTVSKFVFMNIPNFFYRDYRLRDLPKDKMVLFMWEPVMHSHKMYYKKLHECFGRVYTWDDDLVDNQLYFKFYYPSLRPMIADVTPFEEKKLCTLVSGYHLGGKDFAAEFPSELYTERRNAAKFFEEKGEAGFDVYGRGWDAALYPSYRGAVQDKIAVIKNYKFSICYENCNDARGYITEKIFDCFAAGNVPVYWGAPNITDYIPKECFIDRRDFKTMDELYLFLKQMKKEEYEGYLNHIRAFLKSEQAQLFSMEHYDQIFLEAMALK